MKPALLGIKRVQPASTVTGDMGIEMRPIGKLLLPERPTNRSFRKRVAQKQANRNSN